ncbi:hypothetical protein GH714_009201 [Hevea brasiliensis]|uniref:Complex 1 LYR protein domain-containing protein n=1 Tax=Hevea brasiliensis TaxID=3981 RepID=A0A6A6MXF0_HEVBR|nr:hypothetical protein GH714_009201 [Hevea brasiliensis]
MELQGRPLKFSTITHHASVTQCLGSIGGHVWYLGVAKPSILDSKETERDVVQSHCGHFYVPPAVDEVRVFRISGPKFIKLHLGTWHAGPLFEGDSMDFYNLELSNTNAYRQLLKAIKKHIGKEDYKKHFGEFAMLEFRKNSNLSDQSSIQQKIKLARDYTFLLNSVHHHKELLFSYNIAVDRSDEMKRILGKSAASVGLQLPDVYQS